MRVRLQKDAIADQTSWPDLERIILRIDEGAHEWEVDDPDTIEKSDWYREGRPYLRELFEKSSIRTSYPKNKNQLHCKEIHVTSLSTAEPQMLTLPPKRAAQYLKQALTILVENRFTDKLFVNTVLNNLGPPELTDFRQKVPDAIQFDSGGGNGELRKIVEDYIDKANSSNIPVRAVALVDRDGAEPQQNSQRVFDLCATKNIKCHMLKKYAIENYIPDRIFFFWAVSMEDRKKVEALCRLTPQQRDTFHMKKGFSSPTTDKTMFSSVSLTDQDLLKTGFKNSINLLDIHKTHLTAEDLKTRDGVNELGELVQMIVQEI